MSPGDHISFVFKTRDGVELPASGFIVRMHPKTWRVTILLDEDCDCAIFRESRSLVIDQQELEKSLIQEEWEIVDLIKK